MTQKLNIALVTDILPDKKFTAGQVLDLMVRNVDDAFFDIYWLNQSHLPKTEKLPDNSMIVSTLTFSPSSSNQSSKHSAGGGGCKRSWLRIIAGKMYHACRPKLGLVQKPRAIISQKLRGLKRVCYTSIRAIGIGIKLGHQLKSKKYDAVWLVLQGEKLAVTYFILSLIVKNKIILHQWDPIGWWAQHNGYGTWLTKGLEYLARTLENRAYANLVPSYSWQAQQKERGLQSIRVDNFFSEHEVEQKPLLKVSNPRHVNVVFIGQLYAHAELLDIISKIRDEAVLLGRDVIVHYFGNGSFKPSIDKVSVVHHAYMDRDALIERIRKFDIALLPYPVDPKFSQASQYSFPSKSKVYLAAGLPIVSLSAFNASPHTFYTQYYRDYYFNVLESGDLKGFVANAISTSVQDIQARTGMASRLVKEHFSKEAEFEPFYSLLGAMKQ